MCHHANTMIHMQLANSHVHALTCRLKLPDTGPTSVLLIASHLPPHCPTFDLSQNCLTLAQPLSPIANRQPVTCPGMFPTLPDLTRKPPSPVASPCCIPLLHPPVASPCCILSCCANVCMCVTIVRMTSNDLQQPLRMLYALLICHHLRMAANASSYCVYGSLDSACSPVRRCAHCLFSSSM